MENILGNQLCLVPTPLPHQCDFSLINGAIKIIVQHLPESFA